MGKGLPYYVHKGVSTPLILFTESDTMEDYQAARVKAKKAGEGGIV